MLDPRILRENIDQISDNLKKRGFTLDKDSFLLVDKNRKDIIAETENLKNKKNEISKEIGILKSKNSDVNNLVKKVEVINDELEYKHTELASAEVEFKNFLLSIPNVLDDLVPTGKSESNNKIIKYSNDENLEKSTNDNYRDHSDIGKSLNLYNQEIAAKISSSRFS